MNKTTKKKNKRRYTRLIDLSINIVLLLVLVATFYNAYQLQMIPTKWLWMILAAFVLIFLIFFLLMFKNSGKWGLIIKRSSIVILCSVLLYGSWSMRNVTTTLDNISEPQISSVIKLDVIVPKDSTVKKIEDLAGANIGLQQGFDIDHSNYVKQQLNKELKLTPVYDEILDYTQMYNKMSIGLLDAMVVNEDYIAMLETNTEGFKDSYKVIKTYEKQRPVNASDNKDLTKESFVVMISGIDEVGAADQQLRSDVNILLFINPQRNHIDMISLPRDALVPNVALNYANDKLTHTGNNGIDNTVNTVENFLDIDIDYYAKVSFSSLIAIIDEIGGIEVDVEIAFEEQDENRSFDEENLIKLEAGVQHLNGKQALAYARHRHTEGYDTEGRERAQQRIIKAIIDKLLTPTGISYANSLMKIVPTYVVTNMPTKQVTSFIRGELENLSPWEITSLALDSGAYDYRAVPNVAGLQDVYLFNQMEIQRVVNAYVTSKEYISLDDFQFDLDDYGKYTKELKLDPTFVWDYQAQQPH